MNFGVYWALFVASFKMFVRNRAALFFSLVVPLLIMLIFGVLNFGGTTQVSLGVVDEANNQASAALVEVLGQTDAFEIDRGRPRGRAAGAGGGPSRPRPGHPAAIHRPAHQRRRCPAGGVHQRRAAAAGAGRRPAAERGGRADAPQRRRSECARWSVVELQELPGRDLGYIDFLVPGMVALTIMQLGIFSVSFGFVQLKRTGPCAACSPRPPTPPTSWARRSPAA